MKLQDINAWHKIMGMFVTIFIIGLSLTGFLLVHSEDLKLQDRIIANGLLLDWYSINPEESSLVSYKVAEKWITIVDDQIYFEQHRLPDHNGIFRGAISLNEYYIFAYDNSIDLLTAEGELIEQLARIHGIPPGIENIGIIGQKIFLKTMDDYYVSDPELTAWQLTKTRNINWSFPSPAPDSHIEKVLRSYRGSGLPLERIILDLHSGRILGDLGIWIVDISALIFLALSFTGWWSWFKRRAIQKEINEEY
jgi:hypothetical protein